MFGKILKIASVLFSIICVAAGIYISYFFFLKLSVEYTYDINHKVLLPETGQVGDFIGGVVGTLFTLAGFFMLILTFVAQNKFVNKERFESKFFDLLKLHRENVIELGVNSNNGRKEIHDLFDQFLECRKEVAPFFKRKRAQSIYQPGYLIELENNLKHTNPNINLLQLAKLSIPYIITFYGVGARGKEAIKDVFSTRYKASFYMPILNFISMKPIKESKFYKKWELVDKMSSHRKKVLAFELIRKLRNNEDIENVVEKYAVKKAKENNYSNDYYKYYGGNQYKLGHYFRHLFQTFTYINEHKKISRKEKYFYAKTLRAQLSTPEQALLLINSLTFLGLVWDLIPEIKNYWFDPFRKVRLKKKRLITKYNLIKNLSGKDIFGINYRDYYPDVDYEHNF